MPTLRRRLTQTLGVDTPSESPSREITPEPGEDVKLVPVSKLKKLRSGTRSKRRNGLIFGLGGLFGLILAALFASHNDVIRFEGLMDINLDSLIDVIPAGVVRDARDLTKAERQAVNYDSFSVGLHLQSQGVKAHHPIIMVPGVISTGLESWGTDEKSRQYFRRRLWGSWSMMRALILDKSGWKQHIMLDKDTGLDPPGIKLRAAQGFDAADFFITGYWIWNKILENLATIGYDPTNAFTAAYDWRLNYQNLEYRDHYFSRLKSYIEVGVETSGRKVVLASHSMGSQVLFHFFKWVEHPTKGGNGGPNWVNDHVDSWINISGCMLGAPKGLPAVLSGEMKDTAQLNSFAVYGLEKFLSREERVEIFRAMPGISSMLPKGGDAVWGNLTWAPDDPEPNAEPVDLETHEILSPPSRLSYGSFINFRRQNLSEPPSSSLLLPPKVPVHASNLTMNSALHYLLNITNPWYTEQILNSYSHGIAHTAEEVAKNENDPRKWLNPLETRLPHAPDMKIYCFYGVGKPTERSYFYHANFPQPSNNMTTASPTPEPVPIAIDTSVNGDPHISHGVIFGEGDGTVNLLSTGYMCAHGWRNIKRYNPARIPIKTYEMPHEPDRFNPRGGPNTGDHVDILGRSSLNDLILKVAGGKGHLIEERFVSRIREYSKKVKIYND